MADIIENMIKILRKTRYEYRRYIGMKDLEKRMAKTEEEFLAIDDSILGEIPFCADFLITHGVTVQKWISVKDRLPEAGTKALCYLKRGEYWTAVWDDCGDYLWSDGEGWCSNGEVTHWMPLPEPPKGE